MPTNPQDIAAVAAESLAFLAEQGVDTGWDQDQLGSWYREIESGKGDFLGNLYADRATPYDIHAITDMLAVWLEENGYAVNRSVWESDRRFVLVHIYDITTKKAVRVGNEILINCDDNRLAAHLAACREVEG